MHPLEIKGLMAGIAPVIEARINAAIAKATAPLLARIDRLEAEAAGMMKYVGVFESGTSYARGAVTTHDGSAWCAMRATTGERPGVPDSPWRLMVKHGKDAVPPVMPRRDGVAHPRNGSTPPPAQDRAHDD